MLEMQIAKGKKLFLNLAVCILLLQNLLLDYSGLMSLWLGKLGFWIID